MVHHRRAPRVGDFNGVDLLAESSQNQLTKPAIFGALAIQLAMTAPAVHKDLPGAMQPQLVLSRK
jgi:hypothetical protein